MMTTIPEWVIRAAVLYADAGRQPGAERQSR
jgi:hypothetical protein